ncbi:MAG: hypothetical protein J5525_09795 [Lachnospiraceae bacterium]|nr:hypothetical protein [Lachnospiraceae bacterium]
MAVDTDYLDDLMKSIEPIVYPDGVPNEEGEGNDDMQDDADVSLDEQAEEAVSEEDYESELASIPEKPSANQPTEAEMEVAAALEDVEDPVIEDAAQTKEEAELAEEMVEESDVQWADINDGNEPEEIGQEIELDMNMSEEEIDAMLNAARSSAMEESANSVDNADVKDILEMLGDEDSQDIKETLEKSDNNIAVDQSALEEPEINIPNVDEEEETPSGGEDSKKDKKKKKEKKEKKEKEPKEKKDGFFKRLFNSLTEEVPDDTISVPEQAETGVTDENAKILSELDAEEDGKKKRKKKKKKKGKDEGAQPESEGSERDIRQKPDEEAGDGEGDEGKGKKKKKPKKERKPKEKKEEIPEKPAKKLPKKRVRNTFILCLSILAAIIVLAIFLNDHLTKKEARFAFDNADYETAYSDLYGMELNDSDKEIYDKSQTIMLLQRKVSSYENYLQLGMKPEALNALLEGYDMYPAVLVKAEKYGVTDQVNESYGKIVEGLNSFGLNESDAEEICSYTSAVQYNMRVNSIANGTPYEYDSAMSVSEQAVEHEEQTGASTVEDILPEEEDFLPDDPDDIFE